LKYELAFKPRAIKDLQAFDKKTSEQILQKLEAMQDNLAGDVKKLANSVPNYRLRVGNYRVLFEIEDNRVVIYRIRHRKDVYK
jgi:mRNA interferase RelE/StbE